MCPPSSGSTGSRLSRPSARLTRPSTNRKSRSPARHAAARRRRCRPSSTPGSCRGPSRGGRARVTVSAVMSHVRSQRVARCSRQRLARAGRAPRSRSRSGRRPAPCFACSGPTTTCLPLAVDDQLERLVPAWRGCASGCRSARSSGRRRRGCGRRPGRARRPRAARLTTRPMMFVLRVADDEEERREEHDREDEVDRRPREDRRQPPPGRLRASRRPARATIRAPATCASRRAPDEARAAARARAA